MSIFNRRARPQAEERALDAVPWNIGPPITYGSDVSSSLQLIPLWAAVRLLADSVASLPLHAFRRGGDAPVPVTPPALIRQPASRGTLGDWIHRAVLSLALHGNAYGLVTQRDGMGFITSLEWLDPLTVTVDEHNAASPKYYMSGRPVASEDLVHIAWVTLPGHVKGLSPIDAARYAIDAGIGAMDFGADWFRNGGVPPGTFQNTQKVVGNEDATAIKNRLVESIRQHKPIVFGNDWTYTPIQVSPDTAQFVETSRMTATQIASIYGIPPSMIGGDTGGSMTYANVEQESLNFVTYTLRPWLVKLENSLSNLLPNNVYVKFNADALVRTDTLTRHRVYQIDREIGLRNIDEIRQLEDLAPLPDHAGEDYTPLPKTGVVPDTAHEFDPSASQGATDGSAPTN